MRHITARLIAGIALMPRLYSTPYSRPDCKPPLPSVLCVRQVLATRPPIFPPCEGERPRLFRRRIATFACKVSLQCFYFGSSSASLGTRGFLLAKKRKKINRFQNGHKSKKRVASCGRTVHSCPSTPVTTTLLRSRHLEDS